MLLPGSVMPADAVAAPYTLWAGSPARCIGELPPGFRDMRAELAKALYVACGEVGQQTTASS
jgi:hypothetical protein